MKKITIMALLTFLTVAVFAQAPDPFPKRISVTGIAEMEIVPDEIYVTITLKEYEKKGEGKVDIEKIKTEFLNNCRSIGLPDSTITIAAVEGSNGKPWYKRKRDKDELYATTAYQVIFNSSKKLDELVDKLDDDATQQFRITSFSHSKIQEYRKQLRIQAVKAAKEKAIYLTEAIGEKAGEAVSITEPEENTPLYYNNVNTFANFSLKAAVDQADEDIAVNFKKIKLKMQVSVVFAIK